MAIGTPAVEDEGTTIDARTGGSRTCAILTRIPHVGHNNAIDARSSRVAIRDLDT